MKNKKTIITIIIIMVTYLVLAVVLFGLDNFLSIFQKVNIVLSTGDKWQLKNGKWSDIEDEKDYNWKKFNVYIDNQLLGKYDLLYNNKWYIYDKKRNSIKYDGKLLGITGNKKYEIIDFQNQDFDTTGENLLKKILNEKNIDYPDEFTYTSRVTMDIDGDGKEEDIYTVSNAFTYETDVNKKFSIIFINDDKLYVLYEKYADIENQYDLCVPKVNSIIDIGKDSKYELIFECTYFSEIGRCASMYEFKDGIYKEIKSC